MGAQDTDLNFKRFHAGNAQSAQPRLQRHGHLADRLCLDPSGDAEQGGGDELGLRRLGGHITVAVTPGSTSTNIGVLADVSTSRGAPGTAALYDDGAAGGHGDASAGTASSRSPTPFRQCNARESHRHLHGERRNRAGTATSSLSLAIGTCTDSGAPVVISNSSAAAHTTTMSPHGLRRDLQSLGRSR